MASPILMFRATDELAVRVQDAADARGVSMSELMRQAVADSLDHLDERSAPGGEPVPEVA